MKSSFICSLIVSLISYATGKLLFLSLDGFRWDYVKIYERELTELRNIANEGVFIENGLRNNWMTTTFPSHRTLLTGLFEESHGIVGNSFFEPESGEVFTKFATDFKFWNWAEPIWKMADDQGVTSACISINGCDVIEQQPTHHVPFSTEYTFEEVTDLALSILKNGTNPAEAAFFYYRQIDRNGHKFGPFSAEVREQIAILNSGIRYLKEQIQLFEDEEGEKIDLIITGDHGMSELDKLMRVDLFVNESVAKKVINRGSHVHIWPKGSESQDALTSAIERMRVKYPNMFTVMKKEEMPEEFHFRNSVRCPPILLIASGSNHFVDAKDVEEGLPKGGHGFDWSRSDMHPVFIARGPSFKQNFVYENSKMRTVDVVPLVAHLLNIKPNPHNGSLDHSKVLLASTRAKNFAASFGQLQTIFLLTSTTLYFLI